MAKYILFSTLVKEIPRFMFSTMRTKIILDGTFRRHQLDIISYFLVCSMVVSLMKLFVKPSTSKRLMVDG
jgi:hypothetical protein